MLSVKWALWPQVAVSQCLEIPGDMFSLIMIMLPVENFSMEQVMFGVAAVATVFNNALAPNILAADKNAFSPKRENN